VRIAFRVNARGGVVEERKTFNFFRNDFFLNLVTFQAKFEFCGSALLNNLQIPD
jgi:hypothetical protein